ncbi:DUF1269 domain-containing protein [Allorhodopirellula heiligendammensis]|uniref:Uncharacterized protein n=1 Tax=Allorhodopirellula heiligendammensis TaxID=2714739 RepID=A0A5C6C4A9_9BACT|nr:DUF1269 domain-containing protein [Allorhodopirellula heiligendammensis]TWU19430.1 hypothetical protein Poly21_16030 [Allorhodopirellula heiligendammensis]
MEPPTENHDVAVGTFASHVEAESAIKQLHHAGVDLERLSIAGKDYHTEEHAVGYYNTGDRMKYWGAIGAFWGGMWGVLIGSGLFWLPGIGPLVVAGPLVGAIVGGLENAVVSGAMGALGGAIYSIGIPKDSIVQYESTLGEGKFLVIYHGPADEVAKAREILAQTAALTVDHHINQEQAT